MIHIVCDSCGEPASPVWGEFSYSPGGGRHGTERFHFCSKCVSKLRKVVAQVAKKDNRWMLFEDDEKDKSCG